VVDVHCVRLARDIAPHLDRVRIAIAHAMRDRLMPLAAELGFGPEAGAFLAMLRNLPPDRTATRAGLDAVFLYQPPNTVDDGLAALVAIGFITVSDEVALTDAGRAALLRMSEVGAEVGAALWSGVSLDFDHLVGIAGRVIDAAADSGGEAFRVMAPPYVAPGMSSAFLFAEQLTSLRFHRFDAHIAAWRAAGLSVAQVQALEDGPLRDAIEDATNEGASLPYAAISAKDRVELLRAVTLLPG
jgi:hypothetical protein